MDKNKIYICESCNGLATTRINFCIHLNRPNNDTIIPSSCIYNSNKTLWKEILDQEKKSQLYNFICENSINCHYCNSCNIDNPCQIILDDLDFIDFIDFIDLDLDFIAKEEEGRYYSYEEINRLTKSYSNNERINCKNKIKEFGKKQINRTFLFKIFIYILLIFFGICLYYGKYEGISVIIIIIILFILDFCSIMILFLNISLLMDEIKFNNDDIDIHIYQVNSENLSKYKKAKLSYKDFSEEDLEKEIISLQNKKFKEFIKK